MTRILLLRHGQSMANLENRFAGHSDYPLSETGHRQAELAADYIYKHYKVDRIYSSDLLRAYQTAQPVAIKFGLEITSDERLRELYAGEWETLPFNRIITDYPREFNLWHNDFGRACCPAGESIKHMSKRICDSVDDIAVQNDGKCILITTHATPIRAFTCRALGYSSEEMSKIELVMNAALCEFEWYSPSDTRCIVQNITEYLKSFVTALPKEINP